MAEKVILFTLNFDVDIPTIYTFLTKLGSEIGKVCTKSILEVCFYFLEFKETNISLSKGFDRLYFHTKI